MCNFDCSVIWQILSQLCGFGCKWILRRSRGLRDRLILFQGDFL